MDLPLSSVSHNLPWFQRGSVLIVGLMTLSMLLILSIFGGDAFINLVTAATFNILIQLVVLLPLVGIAVWSAPDRARALGLSGLAFGLFALTTYCQFAPTLPILSQFSMNWTGKTLGLIMLILFTLFWQGIPRDQLGLTWRLQPGSLFPTIILMVVITILSMVEFSPQRPSLDFLMFELILPGLDEELLFRGLMLGILNSAFGRPWRMFGASVGWGLIITSLLFGLVHGLHYSLTRGVLFDPAVIAYTGIFGMLMGWMVARCGSIWPATLTHNLSNSLPVIVAAIMLGFA